MPVPWAHLFFSERTLLRTCRRVYHSPWYEPTLYDLDEHGRKRSDAYSADAISTQYLNKYLIRDFERVFRESGLEWRVYLEPFGSKWARWTRLFLRVPYLRELFASYVWVVLRKAAASPNAVPQRCVVERVPQRLAAETP
jgi:hypothetical protein